MFGYGGQTGVDRAALDAAIKLEISHANGIVREGIGLGADVKDYNFSHRILENNLIYKILKNARALAMQSFVYPIVH